MITKFGNSLNLSPNSSPNLSPNSSPNTLGNIPRIGPSRDGMYALIEYVEAGDEAHLVQGTLLERLVLGPGLLSDEAWRGVPHLDLVLVWLHHHPLFLQFIKLCL